MHPPRQLKDALLSIFEAGCQAVDPDRLFSDKILVEQSGLKICDIYTKNHFFSFSKTGGVFVIGSGKAAGAMAAQADLRFGSQIIGGLVTVLSTKSSPTEKIKFQIGRHPIPDAQGQQSAQQTLEAVMALSPNTAVICLLSGGASALWPAPVEAITLADKQALTRQMLRVGASINEINVVRKHLSKIKGGRLAKAVAPRPLLTLAISDVLGDDPAVIGSGPTVADPSTFADALAVLARFDLLDSAPPSILNFLKDSVPDPYLETPKPADPCFANSQYALLANNQTALLACQKKAENLGLNTLLLKTASVGEAREVGAGLGALAQEISRGNGPIKPPACILAGGETTVTVQGDGIGGRNQELALGAAKAISGLNGAALLSAGTDGIDGPTDAAGGMVFFDSNLRAEDQGLSISQSLAQNDSYSILKKLGDLVLTGPTQTNVADLQILLVTESFLKRR